MNGNGAAMQFAGKCANVGKLIREQLKESQIIFHCRFVMFDDRLA